MSTPDNGSTSSSKLRPENSFDTLSHDAATTPATRAAYEAATAFQAGHRACIDALALIAAAEAHPRRETTKPPESLSG